MADVQTPKVGLKLALLNYGTEMKFGNSSWKENTTFLRKHMYRGKSNNMVIMDKFPLALWFDGSNY